MSVRGESPMGSPAAAGGRTQQALEAEARAWLVRLTSGRATREDAEAFRVWRQRSPDHARAFSRVRAVWQALEPALLAQAADGFGAAQPDHAAPGSAARGAARDAAWQSWGRRAFLGAAAAGAAWAAVRPPWQLWPSALELAADYRTGVGEQRSVAVSEALTVQMNTRTSFNVRSAGTQHPVIEFSAGEAEFDVRAEDGRYAEVLAGGGSILASRARFNLRRTGAQVRLCCVDGSVRLRHPQAVVDVGPDRQVRYDAGVLQPPEPADGRAVTAWRSGWLVFDRQPLAAVIDEINRYRRGRLVLVDERLGRRLVQGRFELARLAEVELLIRDAYGVPIRPLGAGIVLVG